MGREKCRMRSRSATMRQMGPCRWSSRGGSSPAAREPTRNSSSASTRPSASGIPDHLPLRYRTAFASVGGVGRTARVARAHVGNDRRHASLPGALRSRDVVHAAGRRPDRPAATLQDDARHLAGGIPAADGLQLRVPAGIPGYADLAARAGGNGAGNTVDDLRGDAALHVPGSIAWPFRARRSDRRSGRRPVAASANALDALGGLGSPAGRLRLARCRPPALDP